MDDATNRRMEARRRLLAELGTGDITPDDIAAVLAEWESVDAESFLAEVVGPMSQAEYESEMRALQDEAWTEFVDWATDGKGLPAEALEAARRELDGELLTTDEAARLLGVTSPATVRNWLEGGHFPGALRGEDGQWRFSREGVLAAKEFMADIRRRNAAGDLVPTDLGDDADDPPLL